MEAADAQGSERSLPMAGLCQRVKDEVEAVPGGGCGRRLGQLGGGFARQTSAFLFDPDSAHLTIAWHNLSCQPRRDVITNSQWYTWLQKLEMLPSS